MDFFYEKETYTITDINSLIDNEVEESIYLEFKSSGALGKTESKKKEISKDVAAFANSIGGIIIYGLSEQDHKASNLSFINGSEFTKEWLEHVINSSIQRRIDGLKIIPVRQNQDITKSLYIVKIPLSVDAPHLSKDKRFYKRFNFESVPMEEYEVRQLYSRTIKSKLVIAKWFAGNHKTENGRHIIRVTVDISNAGNVIEANYKVNFTLENIPPKLGFQYEAINRNYEYTMVNGEKLQISSVSKMPIYPNESLNVLRFELKIPEKEYVNLDNVKITIHLRYPHGEDIWERDFVGFSEIIYNKEK